MKQYSNVIAAYSIMLLLIILVGVFQSWSIALSIFNYCMISAVMTMGANIQWGYAGLINFGIMGYTALGGLAVVLVSVAPVPEAWSAGGLPTISSSARPTSRPTTGWASIPLKTCPSSVFAPTAPSKSHPSAPILPRSLTGACSTTSAARRKGTDGVMR